MASFAQCDGYSFVGLGFEIAGAILIAWTVSARSPSENREEAIDGYGGNFWINHLPRAGTGGLGRGGANQPPVLAVDDA